MADQQIKNILQHCVKSPPPLPLPIVHEDVRGERASMELWTSSPNLKISKMADCCFVGSEA